jgi:hypothetical protein
MDVDYIAAGAPRPRLVISSGEESDRGEHLGLPASGRSEAPDRATTSAGRIPAGPPRSSSYRCLASRQERSGASAVRPMGRPAPGCPLVSVSFGEPRREGCIRARTPRRPGSARASGRPRSPSDFGPHRERSGPLRMREVSRGCDASAADARPGPSGVVRTPPAAAVRPLPGIRRPGPGPGLVPGGRRRARLGRVSAVSTIRA